MSNTLKIKFAGGPAGGTVATHERIGRIGDYEEIAQRYVDGFEIKVARYIIQPREFRAKFHIAKYCGDKHT